MQYLGITAFLENKISVEELAVIGMVGSVIGNNTEENRISVLNEETIIPYLKEHYFVNPCEIISDLQLTDKFSSSSLSQKWIEKFASRSSLERTAILYLKLENPTLMEQKLLYERPRSSLSFSSLSSSSTDIEDDDTFSFSSSEWENTSLNPSSYDLSSSSTDSDDDTFSSFSSFDSGSTQTVVQTCLFFYPSP